MRLPPSIDRRQALLRALVGLTAGRLSFDGARPANAIYTVVSTGSIASRQAQLVEVTKKFAAKPDDPYIFGEKAQLECARRYRAFATAGTLHRMQLAHPSSHLVCGRTLG